MIPQTRPRNTGQLGIAALSARTIERGGTEAEAMAAAAMVGRLLGRYALTMEEVDIRHQRCGFA